MKDKNIIIILGIFLGILIIFGVGLSAYLVLEVRNEESSVASNETVRKEKELLNDAKQEDINEQGTEENTINNETNSEEQVEEKDTEEESANNLIASGQCGDSLNWNIDSNGVLTIGGTGEMWNFAQDEEGEEKTYKRPEEWEPEQKGGDNGIRAIIIEEGVTSIGGFAFWGFDEVQLLYISDSVSSIGRAAFSRCSIKGKLVLPQNITEIGSSAFSRCSELESVTIPEGVTTLNEEVFSHCYALKELYLPKSIRDIRSNACFDTALEDIYYAGNQSEWEEVECLDKEELDQATIHYESENSMY